MRDENVMVMGAYKDRETAYMTKHLFEENERRSKSHKNRSFVIDVAVADYIGPLGNIILIIGCDFDLMNCWVESAFHNIREEAQAFETSIRNYYKQVCEDDRTFDLKEIKSAIKETYNTEFRIYYAPIMAR
jgi:hypothetical protein